MKYSDYMKILEDNDLHIHADNIVYKHGQKNHNRPICNNDILQDLVIKYQAGDITDKENELLGIIINTMTRIVLNNKKFRFQKDDIRNDVIGEAYLTVLTALSRKLFDKDKGNAYSYIFRLCYTAGIHVLEAENRQKEIVSSLVDTFNDMYGTDIQKPE